MTTINAIIARAAAGQVPSREEALKLGECNELQPLLQAAEQLAVDGFGRRVTYSRKVFIPLTQLCRDVCHYCTFATPPRKGERAFMTLDEVLEVARAGVAAGCKEALFTLGDKPELRYRVAREELQYLGFSSTLEYLGAAARAVFERTGLLPHLNPGVMNASEMADLRRVSVSMGLMLESTAERLCGKGMPHWRSPDKQPQQRLAALVAAGEMEIPFTTGLLIGIGETRRERIDALLQIRDLNDRYGHIQEVIIQNFRAKPGTRMAQHPEPEHEDFLWTIAMARLLLGASMSIQAPPNLTRGDLDSLVRAGINDWGGVSPVTPDHVNPEAPWPQLAALDAQTAAAGRMLTERLAIVPGFARASGRWVDASLQSSVLRSIDAMGYAREDGWYAGSGSAPPERHVGFMLERYPADAFASDLRPPRKRTFVEQLLDRVQRGHVLQEDEIAALFLADRSDFSAVVRAADDLRAEVIGDAVTYVVNRNINYTNICSYACSFCAFAKGRSSRSLRGPGYDLDLEEISGRVVQAWERGATEVCLQGGIHPRYTGHTYLGIVSAVKRAVPDMHVHAFSPLEVTHGAATLGLSLREFLIELKHAGLATLPGTAAEILDDEIRDIICADKVTTAQWLEVMRTAHRVGLSSTATIMFGHVEAPVHWARHLLHIRRLQTETGGFTEFVPLPFVHMEAPMWRAGRSRSGPTFREAILMHAIARLVLHPVIANVQASWVKMGSAGAALCLQAGANDLGGTLMNESITRAAGGVNGQEFDAASLEHLIYSLGRAPVQRTTLYRTITSLSANQRNAMLATESPRHSPHLIGRFLPGAIE
jgi:FO synthase